MHRIDTTTKFTDLFGSGKHGFRDGDKTIPVAATQLNALWCNSIQEELANAVEGTGYTLDPANNYQLIKSLMRRKISSTVPLVSSVPLATTVVKDITYIDVPAGVWDIFAAGGINGNGTTQTQYESISISLTSGVSDITPGHVSQIAANQIFTGLTEHHYCVTGDRYTFTATKRVYLNANVLFTVSTAAAFGTITAIGVQL